MKPGTLLTKGPFQLPTANSKPENAIFLLIFGSIGCPVAVVNSVDVAFEAVETSKVVVAFEAKSCKLPLSVIFKRVVVFKLGRR